MDPAVEETLYFGRERPAGGEVSDAEWARFVEATVAPAFPDGFTTWEAQGAWRGNDGRLVREGSQVLMVVHAGDASSDERVRLVADAYRKQFEQEAVLRLGTATCMGVSRIAPLPQGR